jgi:hypothetical protein
VALALAVVGSLSACGSRVGPAAVVDGRKVSQGDLKVELDLFLTDPQTAQRISAGETSAKAELTRNVLGSLIRLEVVRAYADAAHITPTRADLDRQRQAVLQQVGGEAAFDRIIRQRGLTPADVDHILEEQALLEKVRDDVVAKLPTSPGNDPQARDLAFQDWLTKRVKQADVFVNPRFGRFDRKTGEVVPITSTADLG